MHVQLSQAFNYVLIKTITNIFPHIGFLSNQMYEKIWALSSNNLASKSSYSPVSKNLIFWTVARWSYKTAADSRAIPRTSDKMATYDRGELAVSYKWTGWA